MQECCHLTKPLVMYTVFFVAALYYCMPLPSLNHQRESSFTHSKQGIAPASPHNHISEMLVQDSMASKSEKLACKSKPLQTSTKSTKNLLEINQIPIHLRFNKYVLTHYRPPSDLIGCLKSLFYLHNETVNILTHGKSNNLLFFP